jgi:predicted ArsR family transcriptional regulator
MTLRPDLWERLAQAETHPLRLRALLAIEATGKPTTAIELEPILGDYAQKISYHLAELSKKGLLELDHTEPRRGAMAKFYRTARCPAWCECPEDHPDAAPFWKEAN